MNNSRLQTALDWASEEHRKYDEGKSEYFSRGAIDNHARRMDKKQRQHAFEEARLTNPMLGFKHLTFENYYDETYE